jgi:hypothetical protein
VARHPVGVRLTLFVQAFVRLEEPLVVTAVVIEAQNEVKAAAVVAALELVVVAAVVRLALGVVAAAVALALEVVNSFVAGTVVGALTWAHGSRWRAFVGQDWKP